MGGGIGAEMRPGVVLGDEILEMAPEMRLLTEPERRRAVVEVEVEAMGWVTVLSGSGGVVSSSSSS